MMSTTILNHITTPYINPKQTSCRFTMPLWDRSSILILKSIHHSQTRQRLYGPFVTNPGIFLDKHSEIIFFMIFSGALSRTSTSTKRSKWEISVENKNILADKQCWPSHYLIVSWKFNWLICLGLK